jgi:hypothetical protein
MSILDQFPRQVTHTAVFFLPALAAMTGAALRLWREGA